jgi:hypothetical protein
MPTAFDVAQAVRDELVAEGQEHSCILAASVFLEVLARHGLGGAYPLSVAVRLWNPAAVRFVKKHGFPRGDIPAEWKATGCVAVAIGQTGKPATDEQWDGHLVVVVPQVFNPNHALFDLTIPQVNQCGMNLGPIVAEVPDRFVKGATEHQMPVDGHQVGYKVFPADKSFETAQAWTDRTVCLQIADRIRVDRDSA